MKKILLTSVITMTILIAKAGGPTQKTLDAFHTTFSNVQDVKWNDVANGSEACFTTDQISYRVIYDNEGNIIQSFRYYQKGLPLVVVSKLQKRFPGKQVTGVTELTEDGVITFDVTLQDEKSLALVHLDSYGNIGSVKKMTKRVQ